MSDFDEVMRRQLPDGPHLLQVDRWTGALVVNARFVRLTTRDTTITLESDAGIRLDLTPRDRLTRIETSADGIAWRPLMERGGDHFAIP
jgi:hypothetical protein